MFNTILRYEIKKLISNKIMITAFVLMIIASLTMGLNEEGLSSNRHASKISEERNALNGRILDDALIGDMSREALDEYGLVWETDDIAYEDAAAIVTDTVGENIPLNMIDSGLLYGKREQAIDEALEMALATDEERSYWEREESRVQIPFTVENVNSPVAMANGLANIAVLGIFYTVICLSGVFAGEYRTRTDKLILSSRNGHKMLLAAKVISGMMFALVSILIVTVVFVAVTVACWGTEGFDAMVQLQCPFCASSLTQGDLIRNIIILLFTATILTAVATIALSEVVRNEIAVMGIMIALNVGAFAAGLFVPSEMRVISQAVSMAPMTFISPRMLYEFRLIGREGHYLRAYEFVPLLYIVLSLALLVICSVHYLKPRRR